MTFSPDARFVATAGADGHLYVYDSEVSADTAYEYQAC